MPSRRSQRRANNASRDGSVDDGTYSYQLRLEDESGQQQLQQHQQLQQQDEQTQQQSGRHESVAVQQRGGGGGVVPLLACTLSPTEGHHNNLSNASFASSLPPIRSPSLRSQDSGDLRQQQPSAVSPSHIMAMVPQVGGSTPNAVALPPALAGSFAGGSGTHVSHVSPPPPPQAPSSLLSNNASATYHHRHSLTSLSAAALTPKAAANDAAAQAPSVAEPVGSGGTSSSTASLAFTSPRRMLWVNVANGESQESEPPPTTTATAAAAAAAAPEHLSGGPSRATLAGGLENSGSRSSLASPLGTYASFTQASLFFEQHGIPFQPLLNMTPIDARSHVEKIFEANPVVYTHDRMTHIALDLVQAYFALRRSTIGSPLERHQHGSGISMGGIVVRGVTAAGESGEFDEGMLMMDELVLNGSSTTSGVCGTHQPGSGGISMSSAATGGSGTHHRSSVDSVRSVATQSHHRLDRRLSNVGGAASAAPPPSVGKPPPSPHLREFTPSISVCEDSNSGSGQAQTGAAKVPSSPSQLMPRKPSSSGGASSNPSATTPPRHHSSSATATAMSMVLPVCTDATGASSFLSGASTIMGNTASVSSRGDALEMDSCHGEQHHPHALDSEAMGIATAPTATATEETEPLRPVADDDPNVASLQELASDGDDEHRSARSSLPPLETTSTSAFHSSLPDEHGMSHTISPVPPHMEALPASAEAPNNSLSPVPHVEDPEEVASPKGEPERNGGLPADDHEGAAPAAVAVVSFDLVSDASNGLNNISNRSSGASPRDSFDASAPAPMGGNAAGWACSPSPLPAAESTSSAVAPHRMPSWSFGGGGGAFVPRQGEAASPIGIFLGGRRRSTMLPPGAAAAPDSCRDGQGEIDLDVPRLFPDRRLSTRNTMPLLQYIQQSTGATQSAVAQPLLPTSVGAGGVMIPPPTATALNLSVSNGTAVPPMEGSGGAVDPLEGSQTSVGSLRTQRRTVLTNNATVMSDEFGMTTVNDYVIEECLGRGSYGVVYSGTRLSDNEKVAIKCIKRTQLFRRAPHPASDASCYASPVATHLVLPSAASPHSNSDSSHVGAVGGGHGRSRSPSHHNSCQQQHNYPPSHQVVSIPSFHIPRAASPKRNSGGSGAPGGGGVSHYVRSLTEGNAQHADDFIFLDYSILKEVAIMKQINNRHLIRLYEAILDPTERLVYLVMQFVGGGCVLERAKPGHANAHCSPGGAPLGVGSPTRLGGRRHSAGEDTDNGSTSNHGGGGFMDEFTDESSSRERLEMRSWTAAAARGEVVYKPLPRHLILKYTRQIVSGLAYLHGKGILHRDIKPENILVDTSKKHAYLADFGVSEICRDGIQGDVGRILIGTPYFMAPELFSDDPDIQLTGAVDVWALGVTMYAMATGRLPFYGAVEQEIRASILTTEPVFLESDGLDDDLQALMRAMMSKRPDQRITIDQLRGQRIMMSSSARANATASPLRGGGGGAGNAMAVVEEMTNMTNSFMSPPLSFAPPTDSSPEGRSQNPRSRCGSLVEALHQHPLAPGDADGSTLPRGGGREGTGGEVSPMAPLEMPPPANGEQVGVYSTTLGSSRIDQQRQQNHHGLVVVQGNNLEADACSGEVSMRSQHGHRDEGASDTETSGDHYSTPTTQGEGSMPQDQDVGVVGGAGQHRGQRGLVAHDAASDPSAPRRGGGFDVSERQMQAAFRILLPTSNSMLSLPSSHAVSLTSSPQLASYSAYGFR